MFYGRHYSCVLYLKALVFPIRYAVCPDLYQCDNGECVGLPWENVQCDGKADCIDGSDEICAPNGTSEFPFY